MAGHASTQRTVPVIRTLLIDHDPFEARAVAGMLCALGADPVLAATIDEARRALTNTLFDVVVCRLDHRDPDGLAVLGRELAACPMHLIGIEGRDRRTEPPVAVHRRIPAYPAMDDLARALRTRSGVLH